MKRQISQCCGIKQYTQTEKLQQIGKDIIIKYKQKRKKSCTLLEVAVPAERNVVQKEEEK